MFIPQDLRGPLITVRGSFQSIESGSPEHYLVWLQNQKKVNIKKGKTLTFLSTSFFHNIISIVVLKIFRSQRARSKDQSVWLNAKDMGLVPSIMWSPESHKKGPLNSIEPGVIPQHCWVCPQTQTKQNKKAYWGVTTIKLIQYSST